MVEKRVKRILEKVSGLNDFTVEVKPSFSKRYWAKYFPAKKHIRIYGLDENNNYYPLKILVREGLHEVTHHIQWHHTPGWIRKKGVMHDEDFKEIFSDLLNKYNGSKIPILIKSKAVASAKEGKKKE